MMDMKETIKSLEEYLQDEMWRYEAPPLDKEECELFLKLLKKKERPKGKWIPGGHRCPCCGEDKFKDLDADIWADWQPKFCPNCGADMRESEERE